MTGNSTDVLGELHLRGLIKDCSDTAGLSEAISQGRKISVYAGFDPTADSLHVGHLVTLNVLRIFAAAGHKIIPVIGTATALVGDPTGRSTSRPELGRDQVARNASGILESIIRVLPGANCLENDRWIGGLGLMSFLSECGRHIPMSKLLAMDTVAERLGGTGISFLEATYPLLQAYDFLHLSRDGEFLLQIGGSDQWGNICMGLELIGRISPETKVAGMTHPLLIGPGGQKMGKSGGNPVWLNPARLDDLVFFQYWRNIPDSMAAPAAGFVSDISMDDLAAAALLAGRETGGFKEILASAVTSMVRGPQSAVAALAASRSRGGGNAAGLPQITAKLEELGDFPMVLERSGLASSKSDARRLISQGGIRVNGAPRTVAILQPDDFPDGVAVITKGKTQHYAVRLE
jgi:tyrosyl-tRNA synthetase